LKKNRNWALWLSGFLGAVSLTNLFLAITNIPITVSAIGLTLDRNLYLARFGISGFLAYLLLHYWSKAQNKQRKGR
jgi:hypothetical protein